MGEMIEFPRDGGGKASGYLALPPKDAYDRAGAGVVIISEILGLNTQIKGVADRFASDGWRALAVDLFDGRVAADLVEGRKMMAGFDRGRALAEIAAAVVHLRDNGGRVAVLGFCMGGGLAITAGVKVPGVSAVVCFYGIPPAEEADPAQMQVPFLGHFATKDKWITPERAKELEGQLRKANVFYQINHYEADHAFFNEQRETYSADDAQEAWDRTRDFFSSVLT